MSAWRDGDELRHMPSSTIRLALKRSPHDRWIATETEWCTFLEELYRARAWRPAGTVPPAHFTAAGKRWPRDAYCPALGQTVTEDEAAALARAIRVRLELRDSAEHEARVRGEPAPVWDADPYDDETLRAFALFLARGTFRVVDGDDPHGPAY